MTSRRLLAHAQQMQVRGESSWTLRKISREREIASVLKQREEISGKDQWRELVKPLSENA